jgi:hypothetical protein
MLVWPYADLRESTAQQAIQKMATALRFYATSKWNDDYPGGIDVGDNSLDMGYEAQRILRDPHVRRAIEAVVR